MILITLEDEEGSIHFSEMYSDDYDIETTMKRARDDDFHSRIARTTMTFKAYRIAEDPFASMADTDDAEIVRHNFEDVG
jgi:hypothetical protein